MPCSSSTSSCKRTALAAVLCVFASISAVSVSAKRTCDTSLGTFYPYCINVPDGASDGKKLPTVLFLQGRGARGDASQVKTLSTYDGFGKLVNEYESGNTDDAHTNAATKFISIVPVAPTNTNNGLDPQYWYPELLDKVVDAVIAKYPVDTNRFHVAGYSMGAFGSWRYAVHRPELIASIVPSGGNAEQNSITNSLGQTVPAVMSQLSSVASIPVRAFAGSGDTTVPPAGAEQTQQKIESLGDTKSTLTIVNTDHSGLSVGPFTADLLNWMLQQKRSGGSSSSSSSSTDTSSTSSSSEDSSASGSTDTSSSSTGSSSSSSPKANSGASSSSGSSSSSTKKKCTRRRKRSLRSPATHAEQRRSLSLAKILADRQSVKAL